MSPKNVPVVDILILGPYPPPRGGICTHIERLQAVLVSEGFSVRILNYYGHTGPEPVVTGTLRRNPLRHWLAARTPSARLVHHHHSRFSCLLAVALGRRATRTPFILTVHGQELGPYLRIPFVRQVTSWALRQFDHVISVGPEITEQLLGHMPDGRVTTVPAFLPVAESPTDETIVRNEVAPFFDSAERVLVVSAYKVTPTSKGDLHGLAFAVDLFAQLAESHPESRLAIFLAKAPKSVRASRYLRHLLERLEQERLGRQVKVFADKPLWPVFRFDNVVFLRPTSTEGDAVSIREALELGCPVIASDVVKRPPDVVTLPLSAHDAWLDAIEGAPRVPARVVKGARSNEPLADARKYLDLYRSHLEE